MSRVAVVTGGARRIGAAIARQLHATGFDIALHYRSSQTDAERLRDELCALRAGSCELFAADLGDLAHVNALAQALVSQYPRIDLLVNNASGFEPTPIRGCTPEQFDQMLGANLRGPYFLIQGLLPALRDGASIVNLLDVHIERPLRDYNAYGAAKAGLASLTRSLALELGPAVRVNGVAPGAILWPEDEAAYDAETRKRTIAQTPLARLGEPSDIARTVAFLACEAPFITGQVIVVDGGRGLAS
ncbi:MAG: pteridine reductase [Halioglobus sp.]|nr:pteridine reductase [Halioglobus sp.]